MHALIVSGLIAIAVWSLLSRQLGRLGVSAPLTVIALGAVAGLAYGQDLGEHLNTVVAEKIVEIVLAVLLFVDATEVRRGFLGGEGRIVARLLAIALPMSLVATVLAAAILLPDAQWALLLVIACIVTPTDFAASAEIIRDKRIPSKIRNSLNVESGYNDGIVSPLFIFALAVAEGNDAERFGPAVEGALVASGVALLVGAVLGGGAGLAVKNVVRREWATSQALRLGIVIVPLLVYAVAVTLGGNGFVAAFVAGIAFRAARSPRASTPADLDHAEMSSVDDVGLISSLGIWFVFGAVVVLAAEGGASWEMIFLGVLALTVLRMLPVYVALLGSATTWRERTAVGIAGPRGTASVVFGLLAFNSLREDDANTALYITVIVVFSSVLFHGLAAPRLMSALTRKH
ncbi:sodium:proton antiporter [Pseudoclavibacter sp. RFBB5]|uniref:cation:proton antiporter n=1 Tax=Pseudoclavibacter sp. RFBB5 TaxID=2080574 RepID=UPI001CA4A2C3|nr:cation:proton antiporter [Pseudoclavibacter sp. RFBB5]